MERLPDEVILQILSYCEPKDIVNLQATSRRNLTLGRDNAVWKHLTFAHSRAEGLRRRQQLLDAQDSRLAELRNAVTALPGSNLTAWDVAMLRGSPQPRASNNPVADAAALRERALINWDPNYPNERLDYCEEFIHRHAPISVGWLPLPGEMSPDQHAQLEATGVGIMADNQDKRLNRIVAPLDDGSVCIWDISQRSTLRTGGAGRMIGRSKPGLLSRYPGGSLLDDHSVMTETGAVECVAINDSRQRGYFAVRSYLHEIDLSTLQVVSTKQYPWHITALSESKDSVPLTVGTNFTVHLHDPRDPAFAATERSDAGELIGGSVYSHASLAEPGPLSILHSQSSVGDDGSIWVAGRFTSLLNYDRRFFPRLRGHIHSGARIASLSLLPYPAMPHSLDLIRNPRLNVAMRFEARSRPGMTILAAAEYKGKGSLELYGMPDVVAYQNRQTASASKLLSVAPHGGRIVFSDGDGNMKWIERDGYSHVRTFNINNTESGFAQVDETTDGIWSSTRSQRRGQGDIVQKIVPIQHADPVTRNGTDDHMDTNQSNLLVWTGDGALGMVGFGSSDPLSHDEEWHDTVESLAETAEQQANKDAERNHSLAMRRALEQSADEVRFMRGLGMGFMRA